MFFIFKITIIVKRHWAHRNGAIKIVLLLLLISILKSTKYNDTVSTKWSFAN